MSKVRSNANAQTNQHEIHKHKFSKIQNTKLLFVIPLHWPPSNIDGKDFKCQTSNVRSNSKTEKINSQSIEFEDA